MVDVDSVQGRAVQSETVFHCSARQQIFVDGVDRGTHASRWTLKISNRRGIVDVPVPQILKKLPRWSSLLHQSAFRRHR